MLCNIIASYFRSRSDRALVQFTELQPPVGYVDTVSVSEKAKDADPKLIVKVSLALICCSVLKMLKANVIYTLL